VVATRAKFWPNFLSLSLMRYAGVCPYGVASRSCCATHRSVGERVTFTWITFRDFNSMMKKAKSGRKKRSVTCKKSQAPHPRHLCHMIAQECSPGLSRRSFGSNQLHILLDGPFTHSNIQLKEFPTDALRSPESIICCHLLDQCDCLAREPRLA